MSKKENSIYSVRIVRNIRVTGTWKFKKINIEFKNNFKIRKTTLRYVISLRKSRKK